MLGRVTNGKDYGDLAIETLDILRRKIRLGIKDKTVNASVQWKTGGQQIFCAPVCVGQPRADLLPGAVRRLEFQPDRHLSGRTAAGGVQDVCGDYAQGLRSFSNLSRVIFLCSSAAICNSASESFCRRCFKIVNISSGDFPVAQIIYMKPKRCSYSRFPSASASIVSAAAPKIPDCSCADQLRACSDWTAAAFCSPIFGWARKASSQSSSLKDHHTLSAFASKSSMPSNGRTLVMDRAQPLEPQHFSNSASASARESEFIRSSPGNVSINAKRILFFLPLPWRGLGRGS